MRVYKRLTYEDRIKIQTLLEQGKTKTEIALYLGRSRSTIIRETTKYSLDNYQAQWAHECSTLFSRSRNTGNKIIKNIMLEYYIILRLKQGWSPV